MPVAITTTPVDVWPPRVVVSVTGMTSGDLLTVYRVVGGERTAVRSAADVQVSGTAFAVTDAELPFGSPVSYTAEVNAATAATTTSTTYSLPGGKVAITDAIGGTTSEVVVSSWPAKRRDRVSSTYVVGGRNVVVSGALAPSTSTIELFTETESARRALAALLETATSGTIQVRQPGGYADVDGYYAITSATTSRYSQDGTDERRRWELLAVEVDSWPAELSIPTSSYADLASAYTGMTYADVAADYSTYLLLGQAAV